LGDSESSGTNLGGEIAARAAGDVGAVGVDRPGEPWWVDSFQDLPRRSPQSAVEGVGRVESLLDFRLVDGVGHVGIR